jgi:hypothetical protein
MDENGKKIKRLMAGGRGMTVANRRVDSLGSQVAHHTTNECVYFERNNAR